MSVLSIEQVSAESTNAFLENFDSSESTNANWSSYGSTFAISDGVGVLLPAGAIVPVWANHKATIHDKGNEPIIFRDLNYTVDVLMTPAERTMLAFGLDSQGRRMWVGYDISSAICVWNNEVEDNPRSEKDVTVLEDYRPYDGQWHTWNIQVSGAQFDFSIDSHHILTGKLEGYLPGPVGMRSWDSGGSQFDNISAVSTDNYKAPAATLTPTPIDSTPTAGTETPQAEPPTDNPTVSNAPSATLTSAGSNISSLSGPPFDYRVGVIAIMGFLYLFLITRVFNSSRLKKVGPNFHKASVLRVIFMLVVGLFVGFYILVAIGSVFAPDTTYSPNHLCDICNQKAAVTIEYTAGDLVGQTCNEFCPLHAILYAINHFNQANSVPDIQLAVYFIFGGCLFIGWSIVFGVNYVLTRNSVLTSTYAKSQQQNSNNGNTDKETKYRYQNQSDSRSTQNGGSDPYDVLGVTRGASEDQVKGAWREACKKWHPDMFTTQDERVKELAKERFTQIQNAYEAIRKERGWS